MANIRKLRFPATVADRHAADAWLEAEGYNPERFRETRGRWISHEIGYEYTRWDVATIVTSIGRHFTQVECVSTDHDREYYFVAGVEIPADRIV